MGLCDFGPSVEQFWCLCLQDKESLHHELVTAQDELAVLQRNVAQLQEMLRIKDEELAEQSKGEQQLQEAMDKVQSVMGKLQDAVINKSSQLADAAKREEKLKVKLQKAMTSQGEKRDFRLKSQANVPISLHMPGSNSIAR